VTDVERIGIVGAGTMGTGIALISCLGGYSTFIHDPDEAVLVEAQVKVGEILADGAGRYWDGEEAEAASELLLPAETIADLGGCDMVIEAAPEDLALKSRSSPPASPRRRRCRPRPTSPRKWAARRSAPRTAPASSPTGWRAPSRWSRCGCSPTRSPAQRRSTASEGRLGRKSGRGFYRYGGGPHREPDPELDVRAPTLSAEELRAIGPAGPEILPRLVAQDRQRGGLRPGS
jgi:3-hydroxyacyl-CoA dehydrogenase